MTLNNSSNQSFSINADGFALGAGVTARTLTLSGGNLSVALGTLAVGNLLQYNGTNFVNVPVSTFGTGSVTSISVTGGNGIAVAGSPITTAGTVALTLGDITPASVTTLGTLTASNFTGTSSGSNTGDQTITLSGDASGTGTGAVIVTLGTSGVTAGTYGNATHPAIVVVDAKGRVTSASTGTTALGTGSVTSITAGTGLTGGAIINAGTIALAASGVTAGTYNQVVVDAFGRVTAGSGDDPTFVPVTTTTQAMVADVGYIPNNAALVTLTLPAVSSVGNRFPIVGDGAGLWKLAQNATQVIHFGNVNTTAGTGGSITATNRYDCMELVCVVANTEFVVRHSVGNLNVV